MNKLNNPIVKIVAVAVVVLGGTGFGFSAFNKKNTELQHRMGLERIRREWLERQPFARTLSTPDKYRFEQAQLFKWYFSELTDHYNQFQGFKDYERFGDELEERKRAKKIKVLPSVPWPITSMAFGFFPVTASFRK